MYRSVVDYTFKNVFLTFIFYKRLHHRAWGNLPPTLPLDGLGCVNNVLINALKN